MDITPTPRPNSQRGNERININVPPEGAFKSDVQRPENIETRTKDQTPFRPSNPISEIKFTDASAKAPNPLPGLMPSMPGETSGKSFKMMMAGTIIFLTILLITAVFILRGNNFGPAPLNSPAASPTPAVDPNLDTDQDGIPDAVEAAIGTNPNNTDSDGDTYIDLDEIKNGYSPLIAGADGKYTPEQLQTLKDIIKETDEKFYDNVFNAVFGQ
jgi:hypothetical protein